MTGPQSKATLHIQTCPECGATACDQLADAPRPLVRRLRPLPWIAGIALTVVQIVLAAATIGHDIERPMPTNFLGLRTIEGLTFDDIRADSLKSPVIAAILRVWREARVNRSLLKPAVGMVYPPWGHQRAAEVSIGWPFPWRVTRTHEYYADLALTTPIPCGGIGLDPTFWRGDRLWRQPRQVPANATSWSAVGIDFGAIAFSVLIVVGAAGAARWGCGLWVSARAAARRERGVCVVCRYPLTAPPLHPERTPTKTAVP